MDLRSVPITALLIVSSFSIIRADPPDVLEGTNRLEVVGDRAAQMVDGIGRYLKGELAASADRRQARWDRDFRSHDDYSRSVEPNRQRFRKRIGVVDPRPSEVEMLLVATTDVPAQVAVGDGYTVHAVRWAALNGVEAEGLLLEPTQPPVASVVALPDADWSPEQLVGLAPGVPVESQFARRLAENGCRVVVPVVTDRADTWSGNTAIRFTNQPHREFVYRPAFELGRHVIGYEVQKVLAAVDWFRRDEASRQKPVGVVGYGEGGLLALYAAAADPRIDAAAVSGYFQPREAVWQEPIYRNVWALLEEFGDAELAGLIAPRTLIVEACRGPEIDGPPPARDGRSGAAPGQLATPPVDSVRHEVERAQSVFNSLNVAEHLQLVVSGSGTGQPGSDAMLAALLHSLGTERPLQRSGGMGGSSALVDLRGDFDPLPRLRRQFDQLNAFTQAVFRQSEFVRRDLWSQADTSSLEKFVETSKPLRDLLWDEVIGRLPEPTVPPNVRTRLAYDEPKWTGYEVMIDVYPDVFAYGVLLVPKDLKPGERRPVVVCQHGLEGTPQDTITREGTGYRYYQAFAPRLAERGFIVYSPQNPYIGQDRFRVLQRQANPLKLSLFSFVIRQHERTLDWLASIPSGSVFTASATAAKRRCGCRPSWPTATPCRSAQPTTTSGSSKTPRWTTATATSTPANTRWSSSTWETRLTTPRWRV
jgi:dienelactone hydrolase